MKTPSLAAGGNRLLPYGAEHDAATVTWLNRPDLVADFGLSRRVSVASHRRWVDSAANTLIWALIDDRACHVGNALLHLNDNNRSGYFQIYIGDTTARGRGLATNVVHAVLHHGFLGAGLHRIWLHTIEGNEAAERLYAKAGFVFEGKERDAVMRDGGFLHQSRWSILESEWHAPVPAWHPP